MNMILVEHFLSFGSLLCFILAYLSVIIYKVFVGSNSCLKTTMATFAMGYPIGLIADYSLKKIEIGLVIVYFVGCLTAWGLAYILETDVNHPFKIWKGRMKPSSIYFDIAYFIGGVVSTRVLDFINGIGSYFPN